jgi:hypothetical protein
MDFKFKGEFTIRGFYLLSLSFGLRKSWSDFFLLFYNGIVSWAGLLDLTCKELSAFTILLCSISSFKCDFISYFFSEASRWIYCCFDSMLEPTS